MNDKTRYVRGPANPKWKGGRQITPKGYVTINVDINDPLRCMATSGNNALEHRIVMARSLGRPLVKGETVHHKDGNKQNNSIDNLQLRNNHHGQGVCFICVCCGSHNIKAIPI